MSQILVFGDSIAYGIWDSQGGWVARLKNFVNQQIIDSKFTTDISVYNLGISGDTSKDVLVRLEDEIRPRIGNEGEEIVLIIAIGTNDCVMNIKDGSFWVAPSHYQKNLEEIIKKSRKYTDQIILVGLFPVDDRVNPIPWVEDCAYQNENIKVYEEIMESVARINQVRHFPLYERFIDDASSLLFDGLHPNSKGHQLIFERVRDFLIESGVLNG